jgi:hypothetical protein
VDRPDPWFRLGRALGWVVLIGWLLVCAFVVEQVGTGAYRYP